MMEKSTFIEGLVARNLFLKLIVDEGGNPFRPSILTTVILAGLSSMSVLAILNSAATHIAAGGQGLLHFAAFAVSLIVFSFSTRSLIQATGREIETSIHKLRCRLIQKLRQSNFQLVEGMGQARLFAAIGSEVQAISYAGTGIISVSQSAILLVFAAGYLAWISMIAFTVLIVFIFILGSVYIKHNRILRSIMFSAIQKEHVILEKVRNFLGGFREMKLHRSRSDAMNSDFQRQSESALFEKMSALDGISYDIIFAQSSMFLIVAVVVFVVPMFDAGFTPDLSKAAAVLLYMFGPLASLVSSEATFATANSAAQSLMETERMLDTQIERRYSSVSNAATSFETISWKGLTYQRREPDGRVAFQVGPIDLTFSKGDVIFITGGNGSGKSTFLTTFVGLYTATEGNLYVDGQLITPGEMERYLNLISAVFTDFYLFDKLYGLGVPDEVDLDFWLRELELDTTLVDSEGIFRNVNLSSGQKKRLALLVAILERRPLLVLDEWAADQDPYFKRKFYVDLIPLLRQRGVTIVAITHDDAYFYVADRRIHMDAGKVVEKENSVNI